MYVYFDFLLTENLQGYEAKANWVDVYDIVSLLLGTWSLQPKKMILKLKVEQFTQPELVEGTNSVTTNDNDMPWNSSKYS